MDMNININTPMKRLSPIIAIAYIILSVNTLLTILYCLFYSLYEVDLSLVVWFSSFVAICSFPAGLGVSIYALFQKTDNRSRIIILIWNAIIIALWLLLFYVLPDGTNRIPEDMEKKYIANRDAIMHLCRYATDSLSLPDSTALVITKHHHLQTRKVIGRYHRLAPPIWICTKDTVFDIDDSQAQRIRLLHKAANIGEFTVFMPDSLVNIHFTNRGFATYWYEIPRRPYSEQEMYILLKNIYSCPYLPEVSFNYAGGALDHDDPFPKDHFLQSRHIDSTYIYNLFH